ncbi:MAG: response regulator [Elusimicrobia bacterium]|nr:response regulator [Elusimicrobiota bacterium]
MGIEAHGEGRPGAGGNLSRRAAGFSRAKPRILAVDDDAVNLKLLSVMLGKGYQVEAAHSAKEAQELFSKGGYALVLLDLHMPGASGYDCARELRKMEKTNGWKPIPFLALTADNTPQAARQSSAAGMDAVLLKPFEYRQLLATAEKWCKLAKPKA